MSNSTSTPEELIYSIVLGFWQARALAVATELGLADLLAERSMSTSELARSPMSLLLARPIPSVPDTSEKLPKWTG
jgi:hypothetical protein